LPFVFVQPPGEQICLTYRRGRAAAPAAAAGVSFTESNNPTSRSVTTLPNGAVLN